eukprot:TRINITY_DN83524_c0_g1_i1.p1 TRINITY_DN83524_c0_g1~~TRINITY_DN83524_c0_g1_i1.p1  ORF type:complete len:638 (+),score=169.07 TRINITY_DN83524_c0_g1_i1:79-1992(+)
MVAATRVGFLALLPTGTVVSAAVLRSGTATVSRAQRTAASASDEYPDCSCNCCDTVERRPDEIVFGAAVKCAPSDQRSSDICGEQCKPLEDDKVLGPAAQDDALDYNRFCMFECKPAEGILAKPQEQCVPLDAVDVTRMVDKMGGIKDPAFLYARPKPRGQRGGTLKVKPAGAMAPPIVGEITTPPPPIVSNSEVVATQWQRVPVSVPPQNYQSSGGPQWSQWAQSDAMAAQGQQMPAEPPQQMQALPPQPLQFRAQVGQAPTQVQQQQQWQEAPQQMPGAQQQWQQLPQEQQVPQQMQVAPQQWQESQQMQEAYQQPQAQQWQQVQAPAAPQAQQQETPQQPVSASSSPVASENADGIPVPPGWVVVGAAPGPGGQSALQTGLAAPRSRGRASLLAAGARQKQSRSKQMPTANVDPAAAVQATSTGRQMAITEAAKTADEMELTEDAEALIARTPRGYKGDPYRGIASIIQAAKGSEAAAARANKFAAKAAEALKQAQSGSWKIALDMAKTQVVTVEDEVRVEERLRKFQNPPPGQMPGSAEANAWAEAIIGAKQVAEQYATRARESERRASDPEATAEEAATEAKAAKAMWIGSSKAEALIPSYEQARQRAIAQAKAMYEAAQKQADAANAALHR